VCRGSPVVDASTGGRHLDHSSGGRVLRAVSVAALCSRTGARGDRVEVARISVEGVGGESEGERMLRRILSIRICVNGDSLDNLGWN